jgi:hypothetical protein
VARGKKDSLPMPDAKMLEALGETVRVLRMGQPATVACSFAGIDISSFHKWHAVGKKRPEGDPLRAFADGVAKAKEAATMAALGSVFKGMSKDWKAGAWFLGVTKPAEFGQKVRVTLDEEFSRAVENLELDFSKEPELLARILNSIARRKSDASPGEAGPETHVEGVPRDPEPA